MTDILYDGTEIYRFSAEKIQNNHTHGGCALCAAITANLAAACPLEALKTKFYYRRYRHGAAVGSGYAEPMGSLWQEIWQLRAKQAFSEAVRILQQNNGALQGLGDRFYFFSAVTGQAVLRILLPLRSHLLKPHPLTSRPGEVRCLPPRFSWRLTAATAISGRPFPCHTRNILSCRL